MRINAQSNSGQAAWLAVANLISFSFGIVSAAILSRFLSVEEYGSYRQVLYVYGTLLTVFSLGLPRAYSYFLARLPLAEGRDTVRKMNRIFMVSGTFFSLTLFFGAPHIAAVLKNPELSVLLKWFSPTPLFLLPTLGLESVMATYRKAACATVYVVLSRTFKLACTVVPVIIFGGVRAAVIGFVLSSFLCFAAGMLLERLPFRTVKNIPSSLCFKDLYNYSSALFVAGIWGILYQSAPQFFVSRWWGTGAFAEFSNGFVELPFASMIISAVAAVLLPAFSREAASGTPEGKAEILRLWRSSFLKSAQIIYPLAIFACFFAGPVICILYGEQYSGSVIYFRIVLAVNLLRVVPFAPVMLALDKVRAYSNATLVCALAAIGLDSLYVHFFSMAWGIAVIQCIAFAVYVILLLREISAALGVRMRELVPWKPVLMTALISSISCAMAFAADFMLGCLLPVLRLAADFGIFAAVFLLLSPFAGINFREGFKKLFGKEIMPNLPTTK